MTTQSARATLKDNLQGVWRIKRLSDTIMNVPEKAGAAVVLAIPVTGVLLGRMGAGAMGAGEGMQSLVGITAGMGAITAFLGGTLALGSEANFARRDTVLAALVHHLGNIDPQIWNLPPDQRKGIAMAWIETQQRRALALKQGQGAPRGERTA